MSTFKLTLSKILINGSRGAITAARTSNSNPCRAFVTASPTHLQAKEEESAKNVKEAADAVKDSAKQVKETTKFVKDVCSDSAKSISKMSEKVSDAAGTVKDKAQGTFSGAWGTAKAATEMIKDKVVDK